MKDRLFIFLIISTLAVGIGGLFWYGELVINSKAMTGYAAVAFTNDNTTISAVMDDLSSLEFIVQSFEKEVYDFEIDIIVNGEKTGSLSHAIGNGGIVKIKAPKSAVQKIKSANAGSVVEYEIRAGWGQKHQAILKRIQINE